MAFAELIESVADEHPFALLLDDLHWADGYSRDVLEHAMPRARKDHALMVFASRPGGSFRGLDSDVNLDLEPLTSEQIETLLSGLAALPDESWATGLAVRLQAATAGSPLLVLETLQLALETGALSRTDDHWVCPDGHALGALLDAGSALTRRIDDLERSQRWLLLLMALAGTPLGADILTAAAGADGENTAKDLDVLERRGMITRRDETWSVAHDEIADRTAGKADPRQQSAAHAALGKAWLAKSDDAAGLRWAAQHLAAASLDDDIANTAIRWVRRARADGDRRPVTMLVAELFGNVLDEETMRRLSRRLPWTVRLGPRRMWAYGAIAVAVTLAPLLKTVLPDGPGVVIAVWSAEADGRWRMRSHEVSERDIKRGTVALSSFRATDILSPNRAEGVVRPGVQGLLATAQAFADSGGLDVILTSSDKSQVTRITSEPGDDYARAWSPDGRYLAIVTDRWSQTSRSDLAILDPDRPDVSPIRLTNDPAARDEMPLWSPDGTRIAFLRSSYQDPALAVCVVTFDGHDEQCLHPEGFRALGLAGWINSAEIAAVFVDSGGVSRILRLRITGGHEVIAEGKTDAHSHMAGWIACFCRRNEAETTQQMVIQVAEPHRAVRLEPGDPPLVGALFSARYSRAYLDSLKIEGAETPISVDGPHRLDLKAWDGAGAMTEPQAVRWTVDDTTVVTVEGNGKLNPRQEGEAIVTATAGGWRTASAMVTIGPPRAEALFQEDWRKPIQENWVSFGEPQPFISRSERGQVLMPNGDSTHLSGVYLRRRLPTEGGLAVNLDFSTPLTRLVWQSLNVSLISADVMDSARWNLRVGDLPMSGESWHRCSIHFPATESETGRGEMFLGAGIEQFVGVGPEVRDGRWTRLRLQVLPDGRCGVAIDGIARGLVDRRVLLGDSAILLIYAYSHGTQIAVGPVDVWRGLQSGVDWSKLAKDSLKSARSRR